MTHLFLASFVFLVGSWASALTSASKADVQSIFGCAREVGLIEPNERRACFSLVDMDGAVALVEVHNRQCGGDPQTAPSRAFFSTRVVGGLTTLGAEAGGNDWMACP